MDQAKKSEVVDRQKAELLDDLHLMRPTDLEAYWRQVKWQKPNLVQLSETEANFFAPLRFALAKLPAEIIRAASKELDPFGWLLEAMDAIEWIEFCNQQKAPWLSRVWLATASQLRAECRLIFRAHGWSDTFQTLRRKPWNLPAAEKLFFAQLNHSRGRRKNELLAMQVVGLSQSARRRLRRAKIGDGKRAGVSLAEKFTVQYWLELPHGLPGLCFFSDSALDAILRAFKLNSGEDSATKQTRSRLGLIQAGAKTHLIENVIEVNGNLRLTGGVMLEPIILKTGSILSWGGRRLWPPA